MEIETYKWDYIYERDLDKLKELGKQGWEVVVLPFLGEGIQ